MGFEYFFYYTSSGASVDFSSSEAADGVPDAADCVPEAAAGVPDAPVVGSDET